MSKRGRYIGPITGVAVALAVALGFYDNRSDEEAVIESPLLSNLDVTSIDALSVQDETRQLSFRRENTGWVLAEPQGFPVQAAQLNRFMLELTRMQTVEPKTDNPVLYDRLDLGADAMEVHIRDARLFIGKEARGGSNRRYVRMDGEARSYVADGVPTVSWDLKDWADLDIPNIAKARVKRVSITRDDDAVAFTTDTPAGQVVMELAEGEEMAYAAVGDALAGAFNYLTFEDVKPLADIDFEGATQTQYESWDGLTVTLSIKEIDDAHWVRFDASYDASALDEAVTFPQAPANPQEELESFEKLTTWAFEIPDYKLTEMMKHRSDFLKNDEEL